MRDVPTEVALLIDAELQRTDRRGQSDSAADRVPTGFEDLDGVTGGGLAVASTTAVFGHTGVGVSTLALNIAAHAALKADVATLVLSWESDRDTVVRRLLSQAGRVPMTRLSRGRMNDGDWRNLAAAMRTLTPAPLSAANGPASTDQLLEQITSWAASTDGDRRLVVLDGLAHLARLTVVPGENVWDSHTRLAALVKHLAMSQRLAVVYTVPTVVEVLRRDNPAPRIGDVAYSPAYVTDADLVLAVHRPDLLHREHERAGEADLYVLKAKHGPTDLITLAFQGHYQRFVDLKIDAPPSAAT